MRSAALLLAVLVAVGLVGPPTAAQAAAGTINTTAQGVRAAITLLGGISLPITTPQSTWQTGQAANTRTTASIGGQNILGSGTVRAATGPSAGGGTASAEVEGLSLLGASTIGADAVSTTCLMTASSISGDTDAVNLNIAGNAVNPTANTNISIPSVAGVVVDRQTATYASSTGRLTYTVRGLDVSLLGGGLAGVASGSVVVAESTCSGIVNLSAITTSGRTIVPGNSGTPTVNVTNNGDIAAPNTVITIPAPPSGYTLGTVTTTGGGTCTSSTTNVRCTGVTVPGAGSVTVSLPVTVASSGADASNWAPSSGAITAISTPVAAVPGTTLSVTGNGTLVTVGAPQTTGGTITVTPMTVPAGKNASTPITVTNQGPSDATTTVTIPISGRPAGLSVMSATVGGNSCGVTSTAITCTGVTVPANGSTAISVRVAATTTTAPGVTWAVSGITATLNGRALSGGGQLVTVSDPDVNFTNGVTITSDTGVPGGPSAVPSVKVTNVGVVAATDAVITLPAPPAGYTVGTVTTTGGGTCTSTTTFVRCTGVTVPAMGSTTVSVPVRLASNVTADWVASTGAAVTATSGDSTGTATGPLVTANPGWTLSAEATGPAPNTVSAGQDTSMQVVVTNEGPSDATGAVFTVIAPGSTTFRTLTGTAAQVCTQTAPGALRCTVSLVADADLTLALPLTVSAQASTSAPLSGGCVSFNGDGDCADADDVALPDLTLRTPIGGRLDVRFTPPTITPGSTGPSRITLRSTRAESGLTVTVPTGGLPTGMRVTTSSVPSGSCTTGASQVSCTGISLTANQAIDLTLTVEVASSVTAGTRWIADGIVVADGPEQLTYNNITLAITGDPVVDVTATATGPAPGTVQPGGNGNLTVVVSNAGPSDATDYTFTVLAPTSTRFDTLAAPAATYCTLSSDTRAVCTVDLADDTSTPGLVFRLLVDASADPYTPLAGGCVDLDGRNGCGTNDTTVTPIVLGAPLDRRLTVTTDPVTVTPGRQDVGHIELTATRGDVAGLTVTVPLDDLPAGLTLITQSATSGSCTLGVGQVTCSGINVLNGATAFVNLTVRAAPGVAQGVRWTVPDITVAQGADSITFRGQLAVTGAPDYTLDVDVTPPAGPVTPGGPGADLTVDLDNTGPSDARAVTISVLAPDGSTFGPLTAPTSGSCRLDSPTRAVCTQDITVAVNPRYVFRLLVSGGVDPNQPLTGGCVDVNNNGVCGPAPDTGFPAIPLTLSFDRQIDVDTVPAVITPGNTGTAQVRLTATTALSNLTVTIPLAGKPPAITVVPLGLAPLCTLDLVTLNAIVCTNVSVPANGSTVIPIPVLVLPGAATTLVWSSRALTVENTAGDTATGAGILVRTGTPVYTLTAGITGPAAGTVVPGSTTSMRVVLTNTGPSTATDAVVTLRAPVGTGFGDLTAPMTNSCQRVSSSRITCAVTIAVNGTLTWDVPIVIPGNADPSVNLTGGCVDLDGNGACGGVADQVMPDIILRAQMGRIATISAVNTPITPGSSTTAPITVRLSEARDDVTVTIARDTLPAGVTLTGITGLPCTSTASAFTCGDFDFAANGSVTLTLALTATAAAVPGAVWTPTVTVAQSGDSVSRGVSVLTVAPDDARLAVTIQVPAPGTMMPGGTGDLTITITNSGPSTARGARYSFRAPAGTTFLALTSPVADYCVRAAADRVDCTVDVPGNSNLQFVLKIQVPASTGTDQPVGDGCVDTNRDGDCNDPTDQPIPDIELGSPLSGDITLNTQVGTGTPGLTATGTVTVAAEKAMTGITITVPLATVPAGFTVTGASGPTGSTCTLATDKITCTGVNVVVGTNTVASVTVKLASSLTAGVTWTAYAIAAARNGETVQTSGAIVTTGPPQPNVTSTVTLPSGPVTPGTTTTMTVTVTNAGPSDAVNQVALIYAPGQTTFGPLSGRAATDCSLLSTTRVSCQFDLAANATPRVWVLPVVVNSAADPTKPVAGGCVALNGDTTDCDELAVGLPLRNTTTVALNQVTIAPGESGTPTITIDSTTERESLSLVVPLEALPDEFTVTGAETDASPGQCDVAETEVSCTDMPVDAGDTITVALTVEVAGGAASDLVWTAGSVTLTRDDDANDQLISSGKLVTTGVTGDNVTTTFGRLTVNPAAPGQTTRLPVRWKNTGDTDADPHVMVLVIPDGLTPGTPLPSGCVWDEGTNSITCTRPIGAGETLSFSIPLVVGTEIAAGTVISGGCLDADPANYTCGDAGDQALPTLSVVAPKVDLVLGVKKKTTSAARGGLALIKLQYQNNGTESAADVSFLIDPPRGVTLASARILLDAFDDGGATVAAECGPADTGDDNTVSCVGPEAAVGTKSELWLYLRIASTAPSGTYPVRVTISTASAEGNVVNNTVEALLAIAGAPDDNSNSGGSGGDNLPTTGQNLVGLLILSVLLVIAGVMLRVGARRGRQRG
ncbi:hypothetical protein AFR_11050 [Actinoplanes friuliensis DSM 7358]|uniref:Uncharacterized protein n=1 Tax=Actinoplanes friuliensis DSM 7358 TaxID=1246995 RepID=U5VUE8_9ACTN|nr:hypothetical protein AFR_11050 [Actinoplanes friuliensis DSM 7358]